MDCFSSLKLVDVVEKFTYCLVKGHQKVEVSLKYGCLINTIDVSEPRLE